MSIISAYYRLLDTIYRWFTKTCFGSFVFLICLLSGVIAPFVLSSLSYEWSKILAIIISSFILSVLFTATIMDTFGQEEMKIKSDIAPINGISDLKKHYGKSGIVTYIFFYILIAAVYYAVIYSSLDTLSSATHFDNPHPTFRALDFFLYSLITVSLLGFGDITPISAIAKIFSISESIFALFILAVLVAHAFSDS